ncbi:MAG: replication initiation protein RepC [Alphaproteobacteria bacterium]|nr:replication initiation protein RepC [Alphaproteobacteria bacterium]
MAQAAAIQSSRPSPRMERGNVLHLLDRIAPIIGLKPGPLHTLRAMIEHTPPRDWTNPTGEPVCYREQIKIARAARRSERSVRSHEAILERLGLIEKRTRGDGCRGRFAGGEVVLGISFQPIIERLDELKTLAQEADAHDQRTAALRSLISSARRSLTKAVSNLLTLAPKHPRLGDFLSLQADLPRRYEGFSLNQLEELHSLVDNAARDALRLLSNAMIPTCAAEEKDRPHIQATTDTHLEICSGSTANERPARKRADTNSFATTPYGEVDCIENKDQADSEEHKPKPTETFGPRTLYHMAGDGMRMYVDAYRRGDDPMTEHDLIQAALRLAPALGIHESAVSEAIEAMGDLATALSIMVIEANLAHPTKPIHSPGGALRAFSRLARAGRLNLMGSLIGLKQRADAARAMH